MADKSPLDKVLGRKDYKQMYLEQQEEIERLKHEREVDMTVLKRQHDKEMLGWQHEIAKLSARNRALGDLKYSAEANARDEHENSLAEIKLHNHEAKLTLREKSLDEQHEARMAHLEKVFNIKADSLTSREQEIARLEQEVNNKIEDKESAQYKDGYSTGYLEGFQAATELHKDALASKDQLLNLHTLGVFAQQPQVVLNSSNVDTKPDEAGTLLASALAKQMTKTLDKVLDDDKKTKEKK